MTITYKYALFNLYVAVSGQNVMQQISTLLYVCCGEIANYNLFNNLANSTLASWNKTSLSRPTMGPTLNGPFTEVVDLEN